MRFGNSTGSRLRLCCLLLVTACWFASPAAGYVIYLKDGSTMAVEGPYIVVGDRALVTKPGGTETTLDLALIDIEKTKAQNQTNISDAVIIDDSGVRSFREGFSQRREQPTLQDHIRANESKPRDLTSELSADNRDVPRTRAGYPDLEQMMRQPLENSALESDLNSTLRAMGVAGFRAYQGTEPNRVLLELSVQGRLQVYEQLSALAGAFALATQSDQIDALEILMIDRQRSRAGQFLLSGDNAPLLANELLTPAEFFVQYVQF